MRRLSRPLETPGVAWAAVELLDRAVGRCAALVAPAANRLPPGRRGARGPFVGVGRGHARDQRDRHAPRARGPASARCLSARPCSGVGRGVRCRERRRTHRRDPPFVRTVRTASASWRRNNSVWPPPPKACTSSSRDRSTTSDRGRIRRLPPRASHGRSPLRSAAGPLPCCASAISPRARSHRRARHRARVLALIEHGRPGTVYNVCSGRALAMQDLVDGLRSMASVPVSLETDPVAVPSARRAAGGRRLQPGCRPTPAGAPPFRSKRRSPTCSSIGEPRSSRRRLAREPPPLRHPTATEVS